ncbi:cell division protein ZapA [candidate division WOR-3 bacterium]|nr:cell division protein ZapA [candidate division WOR-3 bacterium]MCK4673330.1 cell division protein ZapA [candidate division WOR-3 bacterium]MCK4755341.1 cell division protein ZapA [candidate division WOR-3 bacterium]
MKKTEIVVNIFGNDYRVISDDLNPERIKEVAEIVDVKMKEIHREFPLPSTTKIAVLACLNLVDDYLRRDDQHKKKISEMEERIRSLILKIDEAVP